MAPVAVGLSLLGVAVSLVRRDNVVVSYQSGRRPRIRVRVNEHTLLSGKAR